MTTCAPVLIDVWSPGMLSAARAYVADDHTVQDVAQEAWLGVLRGTDGFQERSSRARSTGHRRTRPPVARAR